MKYINLLMFIFLIMVPDTAIYAQKKALGTPENFKRPKDIEGYFLTDTRNKIKAPWIVICDREGIQTYNDKDLTSPKEKLNFKDWFYVSEESESKIRIFKGNVNSASLKIEGEKKDFGWIEKEKILLWTSGLTDAKTQIDSKAFLLNKAEEVKKIMKLDNKELVKIYTGPETAETIGDKTIYEFYFIMKKEGGKFLLSKNVTINPYVNIDDLIGWVPQGRLEVWNTRICLEPNFEKQSFEERRGNKNFQMVAYGDEGSAIAHGKSGERNDSKAIWANDPVQLKPSDLAGDSRRFKGGVVRFPMLSNRKGSDYFRSGVIGELDIKYADGDVGVLPEVPYADITRMVQNREVARRNYDVLFIIEGTKSMALYKKAVKEVMKEVGRELAGVPSVSYGVAVYRDTPEKKENKLFDIKKLNSSLDTMTNYVERLIFDRWHDNDNYTAMYYGVNQAMLEANMNPQHTNIVIMIGNNADLKSDRTRKGIDECYLDKGVIAKRLADFNAHFIGLQCKNSGKEGAYYVKNARGLMLESANVQFSVYSGIASTMPNLNVANPELTENNRLKNGANIGMVIAAPTDSSLPESKIIKEAGNAAKEVYEFVEGFWSEMNKIMEDGASIESISAGNFAPAAARIMFDISEERGRNSLTNEELKKIAFEKYKLYTEVYIPRYISGMQNDLYSQVLFMPESDLQRYIEVLERLSFDLMKPDDELRQGLYEALEELFKQYTGKKYLDKGIDTHDLRALMQGVDKEGLKENPERDFVISNVLTEKKMSTDKVRDFAQRMVDKTRQLKKIAKEGKHYEFSYTSENNTYFWIPIEYTF